MWHQGGGGGGSHAGRGSFSKAIIFYQDKMTFFYIHTWHYSILNWLDTKRDQTRSSDLYFRVHTWHATLLIKKCFAFYVFYVLRWIISVMRRLKCQGVKHRTTRYNHMPHPPTIHKLCLTILSWKLWDIFHCLYSRAAVYVSRVKFSSTDQLLWATTVGGGLTFS